MLVNTNKVDDIVVGDIVGFILSNGVDGIGTVDYISDTEIHVGSFKAFVRLQNGGVGIQDYPLNANKGIAVRVYRSNLLVTYMPDTEVVDQYRRTVSDIALPVTQGIIV